MTEEEARTKWCYQSQATENPFKCDGSACMAWRWEPDSKRGPGPIEEKTLPSGAARELVRRPGFVWVSGNRKGKEVVWGLFPRVGYCGPAGKP